MTRVGMSGFSGTEFAVGALVGMREWGIRSRGVDLNSITATYVWTEGENQARCTRANRCSSSTPSMDCTCGFYAYHNEGEMGDVSYSGFLGIIEGYGRCILGSVGFRAEKARIVALVDRPVEVICQNPGCSQCTNARQFNEVRLPAFREKWKDVLYPSLDDALAAHPLTPAEAIA